MNKFVAACFAAAAILLLGALILQLTAVVTEKAGMSSVNGELEQLFDGMTRQSGGDSEENIREAANREGSAPGDGGSDAGPSRQGASEGAGGQTDAPGAPGLINLNSATLEELDSLPGIGPAKARAIIEYRTAAGGFYSTEELLEVKGIGRKTFERLKDRITVGNPPRP